MHSKKKGNSAMGEDSSTEALLTWWEGQAQPAIPTAYSTEGGRGKGKNLGEKEGGGTLIRLTFAQWVDGSVNWG